MKSQAELKTKSSILVREWKKDDFQIVKEILLTTWRSTYSFIPEKDLLLHFNKFYSDNKLNEILIDPFSNGIIAEINSVPVAWMKLFEDCLNKKFFVSSLYVLPDYQGFGIGSKLLHEAYSFARKKNYNKVWLGVMEKNTKAYEWYKNFGFVFVEKEPFKMGYTEVMHLIGYKII